MGLGLWALLAFDPFIGIWALLVGFMIGGSARALLAQTVFTAQLEDVRVADIMDEQPVSVPQELTADRALDEFFLRYRWPWFPVVDAAGRFVGVLREDGARDAVENGRPVLPVAELMEADDDERWRIDEDRTLRDAAGGRRDALAGSRSWPSTARACCAASSRSAGCAARCRPRSRSPDFRARRSRARGRPARGNAGRPWRLSAPGPCGIATHGRGTFYPRCSKTLPASRKALVSAAVTPAVVSVGEKSREILLDGRGAVVPSRG